MSIKDKFERVVTSALKQAIEQSLQEIEEQVKEMEQNAAFFDWANGTPANVVESTAIVLDDEQEQQKALPAPILCHGAATQIEAWSDEKKEAFYKMVEATCAMSQQGSEATFS